MQFVFYGTELLFTEALSALLDRRNHQAIAHPTSAGELLGSSSEGVDAYLIDVTTPGESELVAALRSRRPKVPIVVIVPEDDSILLTASLEAGANGLCLKSDDIEAIEGILLQATIPSRFAPDGCFLSLRAKEARKHRLSSKAEQLTPKERAVLDLLIVGTSTAGIAAELGVSEATVRTHLQHLFAKFDVHSRIALIAAARDAHGSRTDIRALAL